MKKGILGIIGLLLLSLSALIKSAFGFIIGEFSGTLGIIKGIAFALFGIGLFLWSIGEIYDRRRSRKEN